MILDYYVDVKLGGKNISYYENLGYEIPRVVNAEGDLVVKRGTTIRVKASDVNPTSHEKIKVKCDYCGKEFEMACRAYHKSIKNFGDVSCADCGHYHISKSVQKKYGVDCVFQLDNVKKKIQNTNIEKYGAPYVMQNEDVLRKSKQTCLERYGVESPAQNKDIYQKMIDTNIERYGTAYPTQLEQIQNKTIKTNLEKYGTERATQSQEVKEKTVQTNLEKYGVEYTMQAEEVKNKSKKTMLYRYGVEYSAQSKEIQEKMRKARYDNNSIASSLQQEYLCNLYGGINNYVISDMSVDIYVGNNIIVEYDGGGHNLPVKIGNISEKEFQQKELRREASLRYMGYKIMRIISPNDKLPNDSILIDMLERAKEYFISGHSWIYYDVENGLIVNSEWLNGKIYNYGQLRRIKKPPINKGGGNNE